MTEIEQYKLAVRRIRTYQRKLSQKREPFELLTDEESILTGIIDNLTYSIQYLETGREPGTRRGVPRRSREQREVLMDPNSYQFIRIAVTQKQVEGRVGVNDIKLIEDILDGLSRKEREAFILVRGRGLSQYETAKLMSLTRGTVQTLLERAERKLQAASKRISSRDSRIKGGNPFSTV